MKGHNGTDGGDGAPGGDSATFTLQILTPNEAYFFIHQKVGIGGNKDSKELVAQEVLREKPVIQCAVEGLLEATETETQAMMASMAVMAKMDSLMT